MRNQDISHGRLAWKRVRSQSEGQLGRNLAVFLKEYCRTHRLDATDRERCKESASAKKIPIGGRSVARAAITREPKGAWTTGGRRKGDADHRSGKRELHYVFLSDFEKMSVDERDI